MKSYNGKINLDLIIPKESSQYVCLLMIFIASVYKKKDKNYYPQVFLEKCMLLQKKEV